MEQLLVAISDKQFNTPFCREYPALKNNGILHSLSCFSIKKTIIMRKWQKRQKCV